jgi:hypothetical protein
MWLRYWALHAPSPCHHWGLGWQCWVVPPPPWCVAASPDTFGMSMEDGSLVDASLLQGTKGGSVLNDSLM